MTMEKPGMSRRNLLRTAAVGVPAMGALSAVNLFGAPAAKAIDLEVDGYWGLRYDLCSPGGARHPRGRNRFKPERIVAKVQPRPDERLGIGSRRSGHGVNRDRRTTEQDRHEL